MLQLFTHTPRRVREQGSPHRPRNIGTWEMNDGRVLWVNFGSILHPMLVADIARLMMRRHTFDQHALPLSSLSGRFSHNTSLSRRAFLHSLQELHEHTRPFPGDPRVNEVGGLHGPLGLVELDCNVTACRRHIPQTSAVSYSRLSCQVRTQPPMNAGRTAAILVWGVSLIKMSALCEIRRDNEGCG